jgi:uncharacterized UBP type Zn finger protein
MLQDNLTTDMSSPPSVLLVRPYLDDSHRRILQPYIHLTSMFYNRISSYYLTAALQSRQTSTTEAGQHRLKDTIQRDSHSRSHRTLLTIRSICNYVVARTKDALNSVSIRAMKKATKYSYSFLDCKTLMSTLFQDQNECIVLL